MMQLLTTVDKVMASEQEYIKTTAAVTNVDINEMLKRWMWFPITTKVYVE